MKININELNIKKEINIDDDFSFNEENLESLGIKKIESCHFLGKIYYNSLDEICLSGNLICELIMSDAIDLSDILYEIDVNIEEIIENFENTLDINEILWENIVLEVPMRVTNKNLGSLQGNGWKVKTEEDEDEIDPRLEKLQELYKGGE